VRNKWNRNGNFMDIGTERRLFGKQFSQRRREKKQKRYHKKHSTLRETQTWDL
jgi:hypothetical protein